MGFYGCTWHCCSRGDRMEKGFLPSFQLHRRNKLGEHKDTDDQTCLCQVFSKEHFLTILSHKQFRGALCTPTYFLEKITIASRWNKPLGLNRILPGEGPNCGSNFTMSFLVPQQFQVKSKNVGNWNVKNWSTIKELQESSPEPTDPLVWLEDRPAFRWKILKHYQLTLGGSCNPW